MTQPITMQDALIYLMVTMAGVDRAMNDAELGRIGRLSRFLPIFEGFDEERLIPASRDCAVILSGDDGLNTVLQIAKEVIPPKYYDTAYALAVELASADMSVKQEEIRFLQMLRDRFGLDKLTCAAIERGQIARFRKL